MHGPDRSDRLAWSGLVGAGARACVVGRGVNSKRGSCDVARGKSCAGRSRGGHLLDSRWQILSSQQTASAVAWRSLPSQALTLDTDPLPRVELIHLLDVDETPQPLSAHRSTSFYALHCLLFSLCSYLTLGRCPEPRKLSSSSRSLGSRSAIPRGFCIGIIVFVVLCRHPCARAGPASKFVRSHVSPARVSGQSGRPTVIP